MNPPISEPNTTDRICFIVNPKAGSGSAKSKRRKLEEQVSSCFHNWEIRETQHAGHAEQLAKQICEEDFDIIAAVGGDGTCHEVLNGMMHNDEPINPKTALALIPAGTGISRYREYEAVVEEEIKNDAVLDGVTLTI